MCVCLHKNIPGLSHKVVTEKQNSRLVPSRCFIPFRYLLKKFCLVIPAFVHVYQIGFTWAGSTSLSITMDVQW